MSYFNQHSRPNKKYYVYSLNLKNGKKYVGMTSNPQKRFDDHFSGNGSAWCQKYKPISINHIQQCKNKSNAKKAETIVYHNMKNYHGGDKVRGAGHTRSY